MNDKELDCRTTHPRCHLVVNNRHNYFTGQLLTERDFRAEQDYLTGKHRLHNHFLHAFGTVCGLKVVPHPRPECRDQYVIIQPGLALDCCGNEIVVQDEVYVELPQTSTDPGAHEARHLLLYLCYKECETEFVPALYSECGCDEKGRKPNRIRESFEYRLRFANVLPKQPTLEAAGVLLTWNETINQLDADGVLVDDPRDLIYVLSSSTNKIMIYRAENHCLLRSLDIVGACVDMALSAGGEFLYVLCHMPADGGRLDRFVLRVIDLQDPADPQPINEIILCENAVEPVMLVAAGTGNGLVYTLDSESRKVTVFNNDINTRLAAAGDPIDVIDTTTLDAAKYAELPTGTDPRAMVVGPDGNWLFVAEGAASDRLVRAARVETLSGAAVTHEIVLGETPLLLAVSGDSTRLFVVTDASGFRAFRIETAPDPFPEIGTAASLGVDTPAGLAASPAGKWGYVALTDTSGHSRVAAVNVGRMETESANAITDEITTIAELKELALRPDGRRLFAVGLGAPDAACGGVTVLDVNEEHCREIFWRALEGCPECEDDHCVLLAAIPDYDPGMFVGIDHIDNRIRPLAPSTESLRQAIACALETGIGKQGPEGSAGPAGADGAVWYDGQDAPLAELGNPGDYYLDDDTGEVYRKQDETTWVVVATIKGLDGADGTDGTDGMDGSDGSVWYTNQGIPDGTLGANGDFYLDSETGDYYVKESGNWVHQGNIRGPKGDPGEDAEGGLEENLNRISALSWKHNETMTRLVPVTIPGNDQSKLGVVIGFERNVLVEPIDAEHVFHVLAPHPYPPPSDDDNQDQTYWCWCPLFGKVYGVEPKIQQGDNELIIKAEVVEGKKAPAVAFVPHENTKMYKNFKSKIPVDLFVRLRCDFVLDGDNRTVVDGEFIGAILPTGNRITGRKGGLQGGIFESWFTVGIDHSEASDDKTDINKADLDHLAAIRGISIDTARNIVEARRSEPFTSLEDLVTRGIMTASQLGRLKSFLKVE
jgi:hypothetical protein